MSAVALLLQQNLIMFLYLLIGYVLFKKKFITPVGSGELGKLLLYVVLPVAILRSYIQDCTPQMLTALGISFLAALAALALSVLVAALIFRRRSAVRQFGTSFSNAGFIGIPLVQMTLGQEAVFYVASFVALLNLLQWTYGVFIFSRDKSVISANKLVRNPILIAFVLGLLLFFLPIRLPAALAGMISTIASMNGPLAMIILGAYLAQVPLRELVSDREAYYCTAVRLLLIPALTVLVLLPVPAQYPAIRMAVLLAAAAPVGSNVAIFAQLYGQDYRAAVKDVCLSTLGSILTMPLIMALAQMIW